MAEAWMTQEGFHERFDADELTIAFVGMSNMGKSRKSTTLVEEAGFDRICCDDIIQKGLNPIIEEAGFSGGIEAVAGWLGQPDSPSYEKRARLYLDHEVAAMEEILDHLDRGPFTRNTAIDTTGSLVHTPKHIRERLSDSSLVVHLAPTGRWRGKLIDQYVAQPKPVIWDGMYDPEDGLVGSYPKLLEHRLGLYADMAHVTLLKTRSLKGIGADRLLGKIIEALPRAD